MITVILQVLLDVPANQYAVIETYNF